MRVQFKKLESTTRPGVPIVRKKLKLSKRAQQARKELPAVKAEFGPLFAEVSAILFRLDPMGLNYGFNTDEYEPEVGTILPHLKDCRSARDVQKVVYEEVRAVVRDSRRAGQIPPAQPGDLVGLATLQSNQAVGCSTCFPPICLTAVAKVGSATGR